MENLTFSCPHCSHSVPYIDVVSSYGIIFLFGKDDGYYGSVCPACLRTTLESVGIDDLQAFKQNLFAEVESVVEGHVNRLQYNSFSYHTDYLPKESPKIIRSSVKTLNGNSGNLSKDLMSRLYRKTSSLSERYCSYSFGDIAMGPAIAVWWYNKEDIETIAHIENEKQLKVFPRYLIHDSLTLAMQNFFWKYNQYIETIPNLKLTAYPEYQEESWLQENKFPEIAKNSEFLSILKYPFSESDESLTSLSMEIFNSKIRIQEMLDEISDNFEEDIYQTYLSFVSNYFLEQINQQSHKIDFSSDRVLAFRNGFLQILALELQRAREDFETSKSGIGELSESEDENIIDECLLMPAEETFKMIQYIINI